MAPLSNGAVAGATLAVATGIASVWMSWGYRLHCDTMTRANAYEREIAQRCNWDQEKMPLHAFKPENNPGATTVTTTNL
ncbi:Hypothetical Protein FCC1311_048962 [Hondaea fermentalgiana]|uniref:Uncharacterized protein n=1 Tax=Hondaea fermentalgiana TaxID=2315210 RepID=A0A2R5GDN3_9STRA|nr:Hypothetical Protein FCC1311_048962 [Hondaea fermentalgiana]|eukprot:GBG28675.1 Hypothetical Protein FCC1311_048962 [Hondaea fermentalgiana]